MSVGQEMVNENYDPSEREETILELFKEGREEDQPWGRANPIYFRERTDLEKGQVEYALKQLHTAGWVRKLNPGLYELVEDPRDGDGEADGE